MNPTSIKCECGRELAWRPSRNFCPFCGVALRWPKHPYLVLVKNSTARRRDSVVIIPQSGQKSASVDNA